MLIERRSLIMATAGAWLGALLGGRAAQSADLVRLGYQVNIWGSLSVVGLRLGIFERMGVAVEGVQAPVGRQTRDAMVAGRIDFGTFAVQTFLLGADKGELVGVAL